MKWMFCIALVFAVGCQKPQEAPSQPPESAVQEPEIPPSRRVGSPRTAKVDAGPVDEPIDAPPLQMLSGAAAEKAVAQQVPPEVDTTDIVPLTQSQGILDITGRRLGPLKLDMPRAVVAAYIGGTGYFVATPSKGIVSKESAVLRRKGQPPATLYMRGGTLYRIVITEAHERVSTLAEIGVGSTFGEARLAHGDVGVYKERGKVVGFYFSDLLGVVFVPRNKRHLKVDTPPDEAIVAQIWIVGPAATPLIE